MEIAEIKTIEAVADAEFMNVTVECPHCNAEHVHRLAPADIVEGREIYAHCFPLLGQTPNNPGSALGAPPE